MNHPQHTNTGPKHTHTDPMARGVKKMFNRRDEMKLKQRILHPAAGQTASTCSTDRLQVQAYIFPLAEVKNRAPLPFF